MIYITKIVPNQDAPAFTSFVKNYSTFRVWRHEHTNYDKFSDSMAAKNKGLNSRDYRRGIKGAFTAFAANSSPFVKGMVAEYLKGHGVI